MLIALHEAATKSPKPRDKKVYVHLLREHIEKLLNSRLLSMLMRLGYISVGLWPILK
jgi:hypothetical protein